MFDKFSAAGVTRTCLHLALGRAGERSQTFLSDVAFAEAQGSHLDSDDAHEKLQELHALTLATLGTQSSSLWGGTVSSHHNDSGELATEYLCVGLTGVRNVS